MNFKQVINLSALIIKPKALVAVVIPIYRVVPTEQEIISLTQCFKVLKNHPIIFVAAYDFTSVWYEEFCREIDKHYQIEKFDSFYFSDIAGYNRLMLTKAFYQRFLQYKYILIHQLDALVFKDELEYWCGKNYDYIGAPWQSREINKFIKNELWLSRIIKFNTYLLLLLYFFFCKTSSAVGNGGLSLRKVRTLFWITLSFKKYTQKWLKVKNEYYEPPFNEDMFFCCFSNSLIPFYKLPPEEIAAKFSVEDKPSEYYHLNQTLPFGCHAWDRYDVEFWKQVIKDLGYTI